MHAAVLMMQIHHEHIRLGLTANWKSVVMEKMNQTPLGLFYFSSFFLIHTLKLMDRCKHPCLTQMRLDTQPTYVHTHPVLAWPGRWGGYIDRCACTCIQLTWSRWCGMILGDFFFSFFTAPLNT